jgi:Copper binding proteins, plastocyanin/azurin family
MQMLKQFCVTAMIACVVGCGGSGGGGGTPTGPTPPGGNNNPPPGNSVLVTNDAFTPASKTVSVGSQVTWTWNTCSGDVYAGQTCVSHSVAFDDGVGSSIQDQGSYSRTFTAPGTYSYHCAVHGAAMTGTITVN